MVLPARRSLLSAACGVVVYYMCDMIHGKMEPLLHAAEAPEITAVVQEFFNGLFRNEEMLLVLIACALTVLLVNAIRHSSADYAWQISIVAGSVAYAVIMIAGSLALDVQIALPMVLIGAAAGCLVGFVLEFFLFLVQTTPGQNTWNMMTTIIILRKSRSKNQCDKGTALCDLYSE